jgi:hypothetical protein
MDSAKGSRYTIRYIAGGTTGGQLGGTHGPDGRQEVGAGDPHGVRGLVAGDGLPDGQEARGRGLS